MRIPTIEPLEARIAPAVLSIAGPVSVAEGNSGPTDLVFHVLLDTPSPTPLTVRINTVDGTATDGILPPNSPNGTPAEDSDYNPLTNFLLTIPANTTDMPFTVSAKGDNQFEPDQFFTIVLSDPSAGHSIGTATGVGTISADADAVPKLSVSAASKTEGNVGTSNMQFTVSLTNPASEPITFTWGTQSVASVMNGPQSATPGTDFTEIAAGTVATIPAGATSVVISVPIIGDVTKAGDDTDERFAVVLQNGLLGATSLSFTSPTSHTALGTILNDEPTVTLDFAGGQSPIPNEGTGTGTTTVNFVVKLSVAASSDIIVDVSTLDGSAISGGDGATGGLDYTAINASSPESERRFTIRAGQTQITVPVKVRADSVFEDDESFSLRLDSATTLGSSVEGFAPSSLAVTIKNDETAPTIAVKPATIIQPSTGSATMDFQVSLSGPAETDVTFVWSTEDLTGAANAATESVDYTKVTSVTATIPAGQTTVNLPVTIFGDADTVNEQFRVNISGPSIGTVGVGKGSALGTIRLTGPTISVIGPTLTTTEGNSGADRDATFTIQRDAGTDLSSAVTVRVSTVDGTATAADGDFVPLSSFLISLPANVPSTTFVVKVKPDSKHEADETFSVRIDSLEIGGASFPGIGTATAIATIGNDDVAPTISIADSSVIEKSTGVTKTVFVVTLSNPADRDITVDFVTALDTNPPTATQGRASSADFTEVTVPRTITIKAGQTSASSSTEASLPALNQIDILGDTEKELPETFLIKLSNASFGSISDDTGVVTITDDEPVISISGPAATLEGSTAGGKTSFTFTVSLDKAAQENIAVKISTTDGTAIAGTDYEALVDKWVIIPAGSRSATVSVAVLQDSTAELSENFTVNVLEQLVGVGTTLDTNGLPTGGVALPQAAIAPATGTITNDDVLGLSINDVSILEGNAGTQTMTFTVTLSKAADRDVTFTYSTSNNTALTGSDFTEITGGTATIPAGSTSVPIAVTILGDTTNESDETFTVTISNGLFGSDSVNITDQFGTGTILTDDTTVSIQSTVSVIENIAGGIALVTVSLSAQSAFPVTVTFALTDGTAKSGLDYSNPASLSVVIPANTSSATISVPVTNEANFEANETFDVYLLSATNAQLGNTRGTVTIANDDTSSKLSISNISVVEQNPVQTVANAPAEFVDMTFTVTLDRASGAPITFDWETLSGSPFTATPGDDYTAVSANTLTIPAGATSKTFTVKVKKDLTHESDETLGVRVFNVLGGELLDGATTPAVTTTRTVSGTISNDDTPPSISVSSERFLEGQSGTTNALFTVALSRASDRDVTFLWRTVVGGTNPATGGSTLGPGVDFISVVSDTLVTILAGDKTATLSVVISGDTDLEKDETFFVQIVEPRLVAPSAPHVIGSGTLITNGADAVGTIRRDEISATIALVGAGTEGNDDPLTTNVVEQTEAKIQVTLSQAVPAGETIRVGFSLIDGAGPRDADATGTNHAKKLTDYFEDQSKLFIDFPDVDDNADGDGNPLTRDIIVKIRPDAISESAEIFTVKLNDATSQNVRVETGVNDTGTVTITDDELLPSISIANVRALETVGLMTFVIRLSHASSQDVTVKAETLDGTALSTGVLFDFTGKPVETIVIPKGQTSANYAVSIRNDVETENIENFFVHLSDPVNGTLAGGDATGTILEPNFGSLKITDVSRLEGSTSGTPAKLVFTVTRSGSAELEALADYTIDLRAPGVGHADAADFAVPSELTGTVTIPAGQSSKTIEISLTGDSLAEGAETFGVTLSNLRKSFAVVDADLVATGTILEDDVTVKFTNSTDVSRPKVFSQLEGNSGTSNMSFGVTLNQVALTDVIVTFSLTDVTTESGSDYTMPSNLTVTIPAGQLTGTFVVPIIGDEAPEGTLTEVPVKRVETFSVNIVSATVATVVDNEKTRTGEIVNDDATFRVLPGATVLEGNSGKQNLVFSVELSDAVFLPGTEYSVDFATSDALAIKAQDYIATTGTLTFTANGPRTLTVTVEVIGDTVSEGDETLTLTLTNANRNTTVIPAILDASATGTIQDDETLVSISNQTLTEGDAGTQQMIFVLSLPAAANHPVVVRYNTVNGTAVGATDAANITGKDFLAVTAGEVTIPSGQTTAQISITVFGDLVNEAAAETFTVKLTSASGGAFSDDEGLGTINEDTDPVPTISIGDGVLTEGDTGTPKMKFRVQLSQPANADVKFKWNTVAGTAGSADDFTGVTSGTEATIPAGAQFIDLEVNVAADLIVEGNETFSVAISDAKRGTDTNTLVITNSGETDTTLDAVGTILDDDAFIRVKASDAAVTFVEDNGGATAVGTKARVLLDAPRIEGAFTVTFTVTPSSVATDVNARSGADYAVPTTFTKVFTAMTPTQAANPMFVRPDLFLEVDLTADSIDEWDEKFVVTLVGISGAKLDATADNLKSVVTITDNDAAPTVNIGDVVAYEGSTGAQFIVKLDGNITERNIDITWDSVSGTALGDTDFAKLTGQTLSIPAGQREGTITVAIVDDALDEADEIFRVALVTAKPVNGTVSGDDLGFTSDNVGVATIAQSDLRTVSVSGGTVVEGSAGAMAVSKVKFTIRLNEAPSSTPVKVNFTTVDGTAKVVTDFVAKSGQAVFMPGQTQVEVLVDVVSDDVAELDETFTLAISLPSDGFAVLSGNTEATGTIEADESVFKLVRVLDPAENPVITEGDGRKAKFKVVRTGPTGFEAFESTVFYSSLEDPTAGTARATATSDFAATSNQVKFAAGELESSIFDIAITNDSAAELDGEKFLVRLTSATNGVVSAVAGESESTVIINDNDVPLDSDVRVRIKEATVAEGGKLRFEVVLVKGNGTPTKAAYPLKLSYQTLLGAAGPGIVESGDLSGYSADVKVIDIPTNASSVFIEVQTQQDSVAEVSETMTLRLSKLEKDFGGVSELTTPFFAAASTTALASIDATGTITNDDTTITVNNVTLPEGNGAGMMTFTATIPSAITFPVSFHYKTRNNTPASAVAGVDYTASEGDVTILAGQTQMTFTVPFEGDTIREGNETFSVDLTAAVNSTLQGASVAGLAVVTGTISNDDAGPQLTVSGGQVNEGTGDLVYTVSLTGEITSNVTLDFATSDGTARASGPLKDYVAKNGVLTFTPQAGVVLQTQEIRVTVNGDDFKEGDETVNVALSNAQGAEVIAASAVGTILDGSDSKIGVFIGNSSVVEGGNVAFTFELTALPAAAFAIKVSTRDGTANASDITPLVDRVVSFSTSAKTASVTVVTTGDDAFEPTERFYLDIDSVTKADGTAFEVTDVNRAEVIAGSSRGTGVIFNDDQNIISAREFEFIDEDGDLVNVRVTKGALLAPNAVGALVPRGIVTLTDTGTVGGKAFNSVNFNGAGREFEGASLFITRKAQAGFDLPTDGKVNVGEVIAAQSGFAQLTQGVNLGTVKIDGDLGKIIVGSILRPVSIGKLDVGSLGVVDRTADGATQSILFGRAGSILVRGDFEGSMFVVGTTVNVATGFTSGLGSVGSLTIRGNLVGGDSDQTGYFNTNSRIGKITIGGKIIGGDGDNSGSIEASGRINSIKVGGITGGGGADSGRINSFGAIGSFTTLGDVIGGTGIGSGQLLGQQTIGKVIFGQPARGKVAAIKANLIGGDAGPDTTLSNTQILAQVGSGSIVSFAAIGAVTMNGDIRGGDGDNSGTIFSNGSVSKFTMGNLTGGKGESSGRVRVLGAVNSFIGGTIQGGEASDSGSLQANGRITTLSLANVIGFQQTAGNGTVSRSGSVLAGDLGSVLVTGNVKASPNAGHIGGGSISSGTSIGSLTVKGSVEGTPNKNAVIMAANDIGRVDINTLKFAEILAGYQSNATNRGAVRNADAQIGAVVINEFIGSSIVAGAAPGSDGFFGQANDGAPAAGSDVTNDARVLSKIASVTIKSILTDGVLNPAGIVAQQIGRIIVAGTTIPFADEPVALPSGASASEVFINKIKK